MSMVKEFLGWLEKMEKDVSKEVEADEKALKAKKSEIDNFEKKFKVSMVPQLGFNESLSKYASRVEEWGEGIFEGVKELQKIQEYQSNYIIDEIKDIREQLNAKTILNPSSTFSSTTTYTSKPNEGGQTLSTRNPFDKVPSKYIYVAREENGNLYMYLDEPTKESDGEWSLTSNDADDDSEYIIEIDEELFIGVKYHDDEAFKISVKEISEMLFPRKAKEEKYIWIARDKDNDLILFTALPYRNGDCWECSEYPTHASALVDNALYPYLRWKDEPLKFKIN